MVQLEDMVEFMNSNTVRIRVQWCTRSNQYLQFNLYDTCPSAPYLHTGLNK